MFTHDSIMDSLYPYIQEIKWWGLLVISWDICHIWVKFFKIVILPKTGHFFFNFKHQLLHIFQWDGQNQDIPYDQLEEESHNICLIFS